MRRFDDRLQRASPRTLLALCAPATLLIGWLDHWTGPELSWVLLYLVPVVASAWYGGRVAGQLIAVEAASVWLISDVTAKHVYTHAAIGLWNSVVCLVVFMLVAHLTSSLHARLSEGRVLAATDPLTGALNVRGFYARLRREVYRAGRSGQALSLAYIDLDNFKSINDELGHDAGDEVLRRIVEVIGQHVRRVDLIARLGGDEFVLVFVGAGEQAAAGALDKVCTRLDEAMADRGWPVSFSIGLATFLEPPTDVRQMIRCADRLMYSVKHAGKSGVAHETCDKAKLSA